MKNVPVRMTSFQKAVFQAVLAIPFGETRSYAWVAQKIGQPKALRAVGQALRRNPYPLVIPCHRVIHADGSPGAYCGEDDGRKQELIRLEQEIKSDFIRAQKSGNLRGKSLDRMPPGS